MIDKDFLRGFVKLYTLWRASGGEVYGLEIMEEMGELGLRLSPGTLYPALRALLKERDIRDDPAHGERQGAQVLPRHAEGPPGARGGARTTRGPHAQNILTDDTGARAGHR